MIQHRDDTDGAGSSPSVPALRGLVEGAAFLCELAMLVVLAVGGWGVGNGGLMGIAFAIFYPALAILVWSLGMAPSSQHRLPDPWRLVGQLLLFAATAALAAAGGHPVLGVVFAVVAILVFTATRFTGGVTGGQAGSSSSSP